MAYSATVTKVSVAQVRDAIFNVSIGVIVNDGVTDVMDRTYSAQYNDNAPDLEKLKSELQGKIQVDWGKYVEQKALFDAAAFDTMVTDIKNALNAYTNA